MVNRRILRAGGPLLPASGHAQRPCVLSTCGPCRHRVAHRRGRPKKQSSSRGADEPPRQGARRSPTFFLEASFGGFRVHGIKTRINPLHALRKHSEPRTPPGPLSRWVLLTDDVLEDASEAAHSAPIWFKGSNERPPT